MELQDGRKVSVSAVILAAGSGTRMKNPVPKQFLEILGKPLFLYSLEAFERDADEIILVTGPDDLPRMKEILRRYGYPKAKPVLVTEGGRERSDSSLNGVRAAKGDIVMIHDAARCCVTEEVIRASLESTLRYGSGVAAVPCKDTIKIVRRVSDPAGIRELRYPYGADRAEHDKAHRSEPGVRLSPEGRGLTESAPRESGEGTAEEERAADEQGKTVTVAEKTPPRADIVSVQTPQSFFRNEILEAYERYLSDPGRAAVTDDSGVLEKYGKRRAVISEGSYDNIKVTTPSDLMIAEAILKKRADCRA
ncbi:MAG: IspD/TarI family cytidylyltransferase [Lachnospiraceae bacterium]